MSLLTPQLLGWRDNCLTAGVSEEDFWNMTIGEAVRVCEAEIRRRKDRAYFAFTNAMTVGLFVASMFSSKQPPVIEDIYPELFGMSEEEAAEAEEEKRTELSVARFIKFANAFNRKFEQNGNRESESQNNG